jgi:hypothetical protein
MNTLLLLFTIATSTLVLRSGDRIAIEGPVRLENGVVTFRMNGLLYSMPASEVDEDATRRGEAAAAAKATEAEEIRRLKVSVEQRDRLLRELEKNHGGDPIPADQVFPPAPPPPTRGEVEQRKRDERSWRQMARDYEETVRRSYEELELIEQRIDQLQHEIRTFIGLGFKPRQFTYQTTRLVQAREQLPAARLEIARAERALAQFREDARREGILPGWLR